MTAARKFSQSGFTVIELLVTAVVLIAAGIIVFIQVNNISTANRDLQRKTAINAMYYALEEVYYQQHKSYPASLTSATLPSVDPELFTDPDGFILGKETLTDTELQTLVNNGNTTDDVAKRLASLQAGKSINYHYDATDCDNTGSCKGYTLRADMQTESQYVKKNRTH